MNDPHPTTPEFSVSPDLQALLDAATGLAFLLDAQMRVLAMNQRGLQHFGLPPEVMIGSNIMTLFDEAVASARTAVIEQVLRTAQPQTLEDERNARHFRHSIAPVLDHSGHATRVAVFVQDITPQRQTQAQLQESEALYRFLTENSADVVWQLDAQMRFTFISQADERMRGFKREEVIGTSVLDVYPPEGKAILAEVIRVREEKLARGETIAPSICFEAPELRRDGSVFWAETVSTRILDAEGRITGFVGVTRNIEERRRDQAMLEEANRQLTAQLEEISALQARLWEQAVRDALTGLYNRHYLHDTLSRDLARAARLGQPLTLVLIDLDHFKDINDQHGHSGGDAVLKEVARLLQSLSRESDVVCRYGGEEFLVVLPGMSLAHAGQRTEAWRLQLADSPMPCHAETIKVTASFGLAAFPEHGKTADQLIRSADLALYESKRRGRNCVTRYTELLAP
ncbi:diguanylate cyclase [Uliginosibacterium sediminicola]|uniref:Diguanylate cyclase n=1 Tax=Uliginosibacterium sediminicola TaxID=2024550 RepID=A0ABU9YXU2_9RHOO